ncbi:microtubule-associated protein RP/EB family member 3 isoform 1 [Aphelenchoides avenae]|nr:microtubule-associated protein RP/EB family member 3 isoform 1 [Aphelenchus avenae]
MPNGAGAAAGPTADAAIAQLELKHRSELEELQTQIGVFHDNMQTYEKERDFYYSKLREIEELCNRLEESQGESATLSVASLKAILYRTEEAEVHSDNEGLNVTQPVHVNGVSNPVSPAPQASPALPASAPQQVSPAAEALIIGLEDQNVENVAPVPVVDSQALAEVKPPHEEAKHDAPETATTIVAEEVPKEPATHQHPGEVPPFAEAHNDSIDLLNTTHELAGPSLLDVTATPKVDKHDHDKAFIHDSTIDSSTDLLENVKKPQPTLNLDDSETF